MPVDPRIMPKHKKAASPPLRPKPKRNASKPVALESVFLELKSRVQPTWDNPEPENYITPLSGDVCLPCDDGEDDKTVGSIGAYHVHLGNALDDGVSWFEILDSLSADTALYVSLLEPDRSCYSDWVESEFNLFASDLLILDRIRIEPLYRGKGYGLYAAQLMIESFGPAGGLAACVPAPYELLQKEERVPAEDALRLSRDERIPEWRPAEAKLRQYWSLLGFQQVADSAVFALSLTRKRPPMEDVLRSYFEQKSMLTSRVQ